MKTLDYIIKKYELSLQKMPIEIPNVGRADLANLTKELDFKYGAELGVAAGEYSLELCKANNWELFMGIDPWISYRGYTDYQKESTFNRLELEARERMKDQSFYVFLKLKGEDALETIKDESLDFCYIDANHKDPFVSQDIAGWYKKVRSGGILAGHDYVKSKKVNIDVVSAVHNFTEEKDIKTWFVLGTFKHKHGEIRDSARSWVIVKE